VVAHKADRSAVQKAAQEVVLKATRSAAQKAAQMVALMAAPMVGERLLAQLPKRLLTVVLKDA
jgi:hypothetical protein